MRSLHMLCNGKLVSESWRSSNKNLGGGTSPLLHCSPSRQKAGKRGPSGATLAVGGAPPYRVGNSAILLIFTSNMA